MEEQMKLGMRVMGGLFAMIMAGSIVGCAAHASVRPPPARATVVVH
jgi:hypothetical protein